VRLIRLVALAWTLILALLLTSSRSLAAQPGVVLNGSMGFSAQVDSLVSSLHVPWVRYFVAWPSYEPTQGHIEPHQLQQLETGIGSLPAGTKVLLDVVDTPQWESGSSNSAMPPRDPADYASFIGRLARRLTGRVAAWEIWNEEDTSLWWASGPDPSAYAALLRASYPQVKSADPGATVVLGGLTGNNYDYLSQLYSSGAKGSFDAVGVHTDTACNINSPYDFIRNGRADPRLNRWAFLGYRTIHEVMLAHGDDKPIWMTELGWNTSSEVCNTGRWAGQKAGGVSPQQQASYLNQAYHCLLQDPYVQVGIWYGLQDIAPFGTPMGSYGLLDSQMTQKPAFAALADYARVGDRLTEPCGDFSGPSISLEHPTSNARYRGPLPIVVSATDQLGVGRITLYYDRSHKIRNFTNPQAPQTLSGVWTWLGARHLAPGRHLLTIQAVDLRGNVSSISVAIWHRAHKARRHHHAKHRRHR
jgi:hypothetical protein